MHTMSKRELYEALEYLRGKLSDGEINWLLNRMVDDPHYAPLHATISRLHAIHLTEVRRSSDVVAKQKAMLRAQQASNPITGTNGSAS